MCIYGIIMDKILLKLEIGLKNKLDNHCQKGSRNKFIIEAINEKLERSMIENNEGINILRMIQKFDPEFLKSKLTDNELMSQTLYEEIKKISKVVVAIYKILGSTK